MTRDELIAALEKATGASRELDAEIYKAAHPKFTLEHQHMHERLQARVTLSKCPRFSESIDAALTLVPDDACWGVSRPRQPDMSGKQFWASVHGGHPGGRGATPAIALCIAALKARPE